MTAKQVCEHCLMLEHFYYFVEHTKYIFNYCTNVVENDNSLLIPCAESGSVVA